MRSIVVLLLSVSLLLIPCLGCAGSKPDPREREDFVDTTDPDAVGSMLGQDTGPGAAGQAGKKSSESP